MVDVSAITRLGGRVELLVNRSHRGISPHWHDRVEFLSVLAGSLTVYAKGAFHLQPGDTLLLPPGVNHWTVGAAEVRVLRLPLTIASSVRLTGIELAAAAAAVSEGSSREVEQSCANVAMQLEDSDASVCGLVRPQLDAAVRLMHNRYEKRLSLAELSQSAGLSSFHFHRLFLRHFGTTPHAYLTALRVERARGALCRGESVARVAVVVGFSSQAHFTTWFRRLAGITPAAYARSLRDA
jgi:AraC-like DNA-binding protein